VTGRQPWLENPFHLISWLDMNKFSAAKYLNIGSALEWFGNEAQQGRWNHPNVKEMAGRMAETLSTDLKEIGCEISAKAAMRFSADISVTKEDYIQSRVRELKDVIYSEMEENLFLWVPEERARFYEFPEDKSKWNDTEKAIDGIVSDRFKKSSVETACVFHLMRAAEVGLKALYKTLNIPAPKLADSWGKLLEPLDEQLKKKPVDRHGDWATHPDFFDSATNDVRAMKRVWRDKTMHIESNYDEPGASKVLSAVTTFFEHLSSKLDQDGNFYP
jgi:hypothetical protein